LAGIHNATFRYEGESKIAGGAVALRKSSNSFISELETFLTVEKNETGVRICARLAIYNFLTEMGRLFIIRTSSTHEYSIHGKLMMDLIYIGVVVLFFVVSGLYVRFCEKL
jgi:hypothetical protein